VVNPGPDAGDIYHVNLTPSAGHEQAGKHYVIVVSPRAYNRVSGLPFVAPVTTVGRHSRMIGFGVTLTGAGTAVTGTVQVDQIKPMDLAARKAEKEHGQKVPPEVMEEIMARFAAIFGFELPEPEPEEEEAEAETAGKK
jgi:mRNA-degrading endonuclease toxin of MazEF toxin-antitoxin module